MELAFFASFFLFFFFFFFSFLHFLESGKVKPPPSPKRACPYFGKCGNLRTVPKIVEKHQLQRLSMDKEFSVNLANSSAKTIGLLTRTPPLLVKLGDFKERQCFVVLPLTKYDNIILSFLGRKPWLTRTNAPIEFPINKIGRGSETSGTSDSVTFSSSSSRFSSMSC